MRPATSISSRRKCSSQTDRILFTTHSKDAVVSRIPSKVDLPFLTAGQQIPLPRRLAISSSFRFCLWRDQLPEFRLVHYLDAQLTGFLQFAAGIFTDQKVVCFFAHAAGRASAVSANPFLENFTRLT